MRSKRYMVLMFDDQASKWTQVAPKPPKIAPRWPQDGPNMAQDGPKLDTSSSQENDLAAQG